jgi:DNA-binding response OmpR family regulator
MVERAISSQSLLIEFSPMLPIPQLFLKKMLMPSSIGSQSKGKRNDRTKPRILYIDDEVNITRVIKYGLEKYGFDVDVFNHPKLALSSFEPSRYDLLLIDVRLPEIGGLDLCNELLKIDKDVKVCFITAYEVGQEEIKRKVSGLEIQCIIKKPVSFETLVNKIKGQLDRDT